MILHKHQHKPHDVVLTSWWRYYCVVCPLGDQRCTVCILGTENIILLRAPWLGSMLSTHSLIVATSQYRVDVTITLIIIRDGCWARRVDIGNNQSRIWVIPTNAAYPIKRWISDNYWYGLKSITFVLGMLCAVYIKKYFSKFWYIVNG